MQSPRPKMAGNWNPVPSEVSDEKLMLCHPCCDRVYLRLRTGFHVEEDYRSPGEWVTGKVRATKREIIEKSKVKKTLFYRTLWPELKEVGLVIDNGDGWVTLPYLWRKEDVSISPVEVREMGQAQEKSDKRVEELEREVEDLKRDMILMKREMDSGDSIDEQEHELPAENVANQSVKSTPNGQSSPHSGQSSPHSEQSSPHSGHSSFLKEESKVSLSVNNIISGFYKGIGQDKIAKTKRERGLSVGRKLRTDGFSLEDIAFAVEWTLENAEKEPYDFAIIEHTIGQALAARDKIASESRAIEERDKAVEEENSKREAEELERQEIETHKADLSPEEHAELRQKAHEELIEFGISEQMITDFLLNIKENEILRRQIE